jgi:light-regulated signal transduction histidine kinase (bacteriophytochrome)
MVQFEITRFEVLAVALMIQVFLNVMLCHQVFHNVLKHCNALVFRFQQSKDTQHQILEDSRVGDSGLGYDMAWLDKLFSQLQRDMSPTSSRDQGP